jgi:hypothetical protein
MYTTLLMEEDAQPASWSSLVSNVFLQGKPTGSLDASQGQMVLANSVMKSVTSGPTSAKVVLEEFNNVYSDLRKHWLSIAIGAGVTIAAFIGIRLFINKRINIFDKRIKAKEADFQKVINPLRNRISILYGLGAEVQKHGPSVLRSFDPESFKNPEAFRTYIQKAKETGQIDNDTWSALNSVLHNPRNFEGWKSVGRDADEIATFAKQHNIDLAKEKEGLSHNEKYLRIWRWILLFVIVFALLAIFAHFFRGYLEKKAGEEVKMEVVNKKNTPEVIKLILRVFESISKTVENFSGWVEKQPLSKQLMICIAIAFICATIYFAAKLAVRPVDYGSHVFDVWKYAVQRHTKNTLIFIGCACVGALIYPLFKHARKIDLNKALTGEKGK